MEQYLRSKAPNIHSPQEMKQYITSEAPNAPSPPQMEQYLRSEAPSVHSCQHMEQYPTLEAPSAPSPQCMEQYLRSKAPNIHSPQEMKQYITSEAPNDPSPQHMEQHLRSEAPKAQSPQQMEQYQRPEASSAPSSQQMVQYLRSDSLNAHSPHHIEQYYTTPHHSPHHIEQYLTSEASNTHSPHHIEQYLTSEAPSTHSPQQMAQYLRSEASSTHIPQNMEQYPRSEAPSTHSPQHMEQFPRSEAASTTALSTWNSSQDRRLPALTASTLGTVPRAEAPSTNSPQHMEQYLRSEVPKAQSPQQMEQYLRSEAPSTHSSQQTFTNMDATHNNANLENPYWSFVPEDCPGSKVHLATPNPSLKPMDLSPPHALSAPSTPSPCQSRWVQSSLDLGLLRAQHARRRWRHPSPHAVAQGKRALAYVLAANMSVSGTLDARERNGQTALHIAAATNQHLIVSDLLEHGAQVHTQDSWGRSPLHVCVEKGHVHSLLAIIRTHKALGKHLNVDMVNYDGLTSLHVAVLAHNATLRQVSYLDKSSSGKEWNHLMKKNLCYFDCVKALLQMGASCGAKDQKSAVHSLCRQPADVWRNTALHMVCALENCKRQVEAVKMLIRKGADPGARNLENELPVQLLPEGGNTEKVRQMLRGRILHM
ncbi:hypothetical protein WMY93_022513 [Mugilogobius chulae]|uniref:NF-kappa-B inhibitor zeta n=1 Tax=Mugilogobius chulae TaxID=88201 RepID=A0AAW0NE79_9GOBI